MVNNSTLFVQTARQKRSAERSDALSRNMVTVRERVVG